MNGSPPSTNGTPTVDSNAQGGEADVPHRGFTVRLKSAWDLEFSNLRWRLLVCVLLARLLPDGRAGVIRATLLRAIGPRVGRGTRVFGMPKLQWSPPGSARARLRIGANCTIGTGTILEFGEAITIGDGVSLADGVVILTTTHELGPRVRRAGPLVRNPVRIDDEVEIGERAIVLPGVIVGAGARILAHSVVTRSVPAGATVSGIPARVLRPA